MSIAARVSARLLANAIAARLSEVTGATGFYGRIGTTLPGASHDAPVTVPQKADRSGVQPYFVMTLSPGALGPEADLADTYLDTTATVQVTVAGSSLDDVLGLADRVDAALLRWAPTVAGALPGPLRPPPGFDPGPVLTDKAEEPPRPYTALLYQMSTTPA